MDNLLADINTTVRVSSGIEIIISTPSKVI
jgi:hypothetical protein